MFTAAAGELPGVSYILTTPGALAANLGLGLVCSLAAQWLYTAALQRFWLDKIAADLLVKPTMSFAQDARGLEENFIDRLLGDPGRGKPVHVERPLVMADGLPGRALASVSEILERLENRLLLRGRGGSAEQLLQRLGNYLRIVENLLEQPRYLMMAVMATFVVIL